MSLLDWVEKHLQSQGLLPLDVSGVQRSIDFVLGEFNLTWQSKETRGHRMEIHLEQKLAYKQESRPMMQWVVTCDGDAEKAISGQVLLSSTIRPLELSELLGKAVEAHISGRSEKETDRTPSPAPEDELEDELNLDDILAAPDTAASDDDQLSVEDLLKEANSAPEKPAIDATRAKKKLNS